MGNILQSLKAVAVQRPTKLTPAVRRRNKLIDSLHQQIEAAKARSEGRQHSIKKLRRIRSKQTGEMIDTVRDKAVKECWWVGEDGHAYMEVRYGWKPLEIVKGKTTIDVGSVQNVIPTLEKLRAATEVGEFDGQLEAAFSRLGEQLRARKASKSK
jgi:hypothetical protein